MSLRGDLTTISLSEVFRLINATGKEGTLIVSDADSKKAIYFSNTGIRLISTGTRKGLRLGELLVKSGIVNGEQLSQALNIQKNSHLKLGEILIQLKFTTVENIQRLVQFQIEEEIYDLYNWKDANFEFIEGPPPPELADQTQQATGLHLDINTLMTEANRRLEEWKSIRQVLTNTKAIYTLTEEAEERLTKADLPEAFKSVIPLINGLRTVEDIVDECHLVSSFEAYKVIYLLITKGLVAEVSFDRIKDNARQLLKQNKTEQALLLYYQAVKLKPDDFTINQNLAEVLEKLGRQSEAGEHYKKLGELFEQKSMYPQAALAYQKALAYLPEDEGVYIKIFDRAVVAQQITEAVSVGKQLLKLYGKGKDPQKVASLATKLYNLKSPDFEIKAYVSSAYFVMGEYEKARAELEGAIKSLSFLKTADLIKAYESVLKIEPNHSDARYHRDLLLNQVARKKKKRRFILITGCILFVLALIAGAFIGYDRYYIKEKFVLLKSEVEQLKDKKLYHEAMRKYQDFNHPLAWTTTREVKQEIIQIQSLLSKSLQARADAIAAEFGALADLFKELDATEQSKQDLEGALISYQALLTRINQKSQEIFSGEISVQEKVPNYESKKEEFRQLSVATERKIKGISNYFQSATALYTRIQEFDKADKLQDATKLIYQLVNAYPLSPIAKALKIPVRVESDPSGAEVYVDNDKAGNTPTKIYLPLQGAVALRIAKSGFSPVNKQVKAYEQSDIKVQLDKTVLWTFRAGGPIESKPLILDNLVIVTSRDGYVYAVEKDKGELKWKFKTDSSQEIISSPQFNGNLIVFGCYDALFYALRYDSTGVAKLWTAKTSAIIKSSPFFSQDGASIFVGCADSNLYAFSTKGDLLWKFLAGGKISNSGSSGEDVVYIPCDDGNLYAVDSKTGVEKWRLSLTGKLSALTDNANITYVGTSNNNCYAVDTINHQVKWTYKTKGGIISAPTFFNNTVFVTSQDKSLHAIDANKGNLKWIFATKNAISGGSVIAPDGIIYFGGEDNFIYAINGATGQEIWRYKTNAKIRSTPSISGNMIYVGCDDASLYALER